MSNELSLPDLPEGYRWKISRDTVLRDSCRVKVQKHVVWGWWRTIADHWVSILFSESIEAAIYRAALHCYKAAFSSDHMKAAKYYGVYKNVS